MSRNWTAGRFVGDAMMNTVTQTQPPERMLRTPHFLIRFHWIWNADSSVSGKMCAELLSTEKCSHVVSQSLCQRAAITLAKRMANKISRGRALSSSFWFRIWKTT